VVPFYNNADVLGDCLVSIAAQTFRDLEVIMVDDGSTDDAARLARARAAADPRFTLLQTPNGGPGRARNLGVERATGEFLAFVDGDDMLPPHAYETLLHTLESWGSDFVSGAVQRIGTGGVHPSALHVVLSGTEEYFEALARCRYVVSNDDMQPEFRKRDGQVYLQTWHGTPLKKIGFDIGKPQFASGTAYLDHLAADVAKWDLLLSQNPFSTPILRRAFGSAAKSVSTATHATTGCPAVARARPCSASVFAFQTESAWCSTPRRGGTTSTTPPAGTASTCGWTWTGRPRRWAGITCC